ncbi:MAG: hypothetical protein LBJ38_01045 [Oscillospiraceae bacterium]|jgi:hypothetical protein|nr:hypothetical protein [Oscillospiraceae bacterium]
MSDMSDTCATFIVIIAMLGTLVVRVVSSDNIIIFASENPMVDEDEHEDDTSGSSSC